MVEELVLDCVRKIAEGESMYLLHIDHVIGRLHVILSGIFDDRQAEALRSELAQRIHELPGKFHVLCDVSSLEKFDRSARKNYRTVMDMLAAAGVHKVVRIVPDVHHNFGLTVMSHFHYADIPVITCRSFDEALRHLRGK